MIKKRTKIKLLSFTLITLFFFGILASTVKASTNYQLVLTKGTEEYVIEVYDDTIWKSTVDLTSNPKLFFEGDANVTGAKSKQTIKGWRDVTYTTYDALLSLYLSIPEYGIWNTYLTNLTKAGYNESTINTNYPNTYNAWYGISAEWWFTAGEYEETPNTTLSPIIIMKNPLDYNLILDDCNELMEEILNEPSLFFLTPFLSNKTSDEFMWQLIFYGFGTASPQRNYLETLINELDCDNVSTTESTLIFTRTGVTEYKAEVSYGSKGILSHFIVKDSSDDVIYRIISANTEWIFFTILTLSVAVACITIVIIVYNNRRIKK